MQLHGPKRVYNLTALESWFGRLVDSWEPYFPGSSLEKGRQFYREGLVREIELGETDAIIHSKIDGRECYAVIEWADSRPQARASVDERSLGEALAVAGLYEIEEMIVDEISPLPADTEEEREKPEDASLKSLARAKRGDEAPARSLLLEFECAEEGLLFAAYWVKTNDSGERTRALPNGGEGNGLVSSERERLIRLASLSRKAHFRLLQESQSYLLEDPWQIRAFLTNDLPAWKRYFDVRLSPEAEQLKSGVREVDVSVRAAGGKKGGLDLKWIFQAGEALLGPKDLSRLERAGEKPVLVPSVGFVRLGAPESRAYREWKENAKAAGEKETPRYLLLSLFNQSSVRVEPSKELSQWKERLVEEPEPVEDLPGFLRGYQRQGVAWMNRLAELGCHGLLADEMGLGKTVQTLALIAARPLEERTHIIVTPASVIPVWEKEAARFFPNLPVQVLSSGNNFVEQPAEGIWIGSYNQLRRHVHLLKKIRFGYAVLDEGQLIKNPEAKVTRACFSIDARHRFILTGTPLENRGLDLWSLFHFLMPGLLGTRSGFEQAAAADREAFQARMRAQIAPFVMRRTKERVASELPQKIEMAVSAPLTPLQREEYARICREGINRLGDDLEPVVRERSFGLFSLLTRLRQVCCDPGLLPWQNAGYRDSGKITTLLEQLAPVLEEGHKVVVFSQFVSLLNRVEEAMAVHYPDLARFRLTGATVDREAPVSGFQEHEGAAAMLISLRAGGTGITLHAADYVFLLDPWWNPAVEEQAIDRVHRIGQTNTVMVCRIVTAGTIEERIQELKEEKRGLFRDLLGDLGAAGEMRARFHSLRSLIEIREDVNPDPDS